MQRQTQRIPVQHLTGCKYACGSSVAGIRFGLIVTMTTFFLHSFQKIKINNSFCYILDFPGSSSNRNNIHVIL